MPADLSRFGPRVREVVAPPFDWDVALDLSPIAGKSSMSLLWRKWRPTVAMAWHGQFRLQEPAIGHRHRRILWIYKGTPQVGDSLMDLSSRVLLRNAGHEVDLYTDAHLHRLYEADDVFGKVSSDPDDFAGRPYDLAILDSFKGRCLDAKLRRWKALPFVTMRGFFNGPEFNRTLCSFFRMQQLLGLPVNEAETAHRALPHLCAGAADEEMAAALQVPRGALAFALGGAQPERTYMLWDRVMLRLAREHRLPAVVLLGAANGKAMRDRVLDTLAGTDIAIVDCVDRTTLTQAYAVLRRCSLAVAADGGLLHLAHAARLPTVALFDDKIAPALRLTAANRSLALQSAGEISALAEADVAEAIDRALRIYGGNMEAGEMRA